MSQRTDKPKEECGVFGVSTATGEAPGITYNGLLTLQHRGQEGAGIALLYGNRLLHHKNTGLVNEVFTPQVLQKLPKSPVAVGHCRYSTTGSSSGENVQPFITEYLTGRIATVHNGNIVNARTLQRMLQGCGVEFSASSDSEVISALAAYEILKAGDAAAGLKRTARQLQGAYCLLVLTGEGQLLALRDPYGFRPLCVGQNDCGVAVASESCALDSQGFAFLRDIAPGELLVIEDGKITHSEQVFPEHKKTGLCIFEYVYFARPDSVIDGLSVYESRFQMGRELAKEQPADADIVCGIPDSGMEAAMGYAAQSGLPLVSGFVKNRYIGRSFILPLQNQREAAVKTKLNPLAATLRGRRVVLVDDSIVRGTTTDLTIQGVRGAGATAVHLRIASPPSRHACHFGTDIDNEDNLIANRMSLAGFTKKIGADSLAYLSLEGLRAACAGCKLDFCTGCFSGQYNISPGGHTKQELKEG